MKIMLFLLQLLLSVDLAVIVTVAVIISHVGCCYYRLFYLVLLFLSSIW